MPAAPNDYTRRVSFDGRHDVDARTRAQINAVEGILGHAVYMAQGSWSFSPLSAGTHGGAGAADLVPTGPVTYRHLETAMRCVGMAAWFRPWAGNYHCHGISIGNPAVAWLAALQVGAYHAGYDGLGAHARAGHDTGTRLYAGVTWESYQQQHQLPDIQQPEAPVTVVEKGFWRGKDQKIPADKLWHTLLINDTDDVSFATGPGKIVSGGVEFSIKAPPPGTFAYFRLIQVDVDERTGKITSSNPGLVLTKNATNIDTVPLSLTLGAAPKGHARRLRVQIQVTKAVVVDRIHTHYFKES